MGHVTDADTAGGFDRRAGRARRAVPGARVASSRRRRSTSLDEATIGFLAASPFALIGRWAPTASVDVSPRAARRVHPGARRRHVAIPDLNGNNLIDTPPRGRGDGPAGLLFIGARQGRDDPHQRPCVGDHRCRDARPLARRTPAADHGDRRADRRGVHALRQGVPSWPGVGPGELGRAGRRSRRPRCARRSGAGRDQRRCDSRVPGACVRSGSRCRSARAPEPGERTAITGSRTSPTTWARPTTATRTPRAPCRRSTTSSRHSAWCRVTGSSTSVAAPAATRSSSPGVASTSTASTSANASSTSPDPRQR